MVPFLLHVALEYLWRCLLFALHSGGCSGLLSVYQMHDWLRLARAELPRCLQRKGRSPGEIVGKR